MRIRQRILELKKQNENIGRNQNILLIRTLTESDAEAVLEHLKMTCGETDYLSKYEDEVDITLDGERAFLNNLEKEESALMLGGFLDGELAVVASILPISNRDRMRHRGGLGICVQKRYWGLGIGKALLVTLMDEAKQAGFEQVELEVAAENERAVKLYETCGFEQYGVRKKGMGLRDGSYLDEVLMLREV